MPSIKQRGPNAYLVTVSCGYRTNGKKIYKNKTFHVDGSLSPKQQEKEINRLAVIFEDDVKKGQFLDPSTTFETFANRWLNEYAAGRLHRKTISSYRTELNNKILPAIGHLRLGKLQPLHLIQFYTNLTAPGSRLDGKSGIYSSRTIKYCHQIISSILQTAVQWQLLADNPARRVKPPKGAENIKRNNYFDDIQTAIFLNYIKAEPLKYQALANIAIFGGLRLEEVLPLNWSDIDFKNNTIDINKTLSYVDGEQLILNETKTEGSTRRITLPRSVFTLLRDYRMNDISAERLFDMHYCTPGKWLNKAIKRFNLSAAEPLPLITFHGLRHTSITLLISQGVDIRTVSSRAGHSNPSTTLNIYSHYIKSRDAAASDALDGLLNKNALLAEKNV